jgi:hypothetical protein
MDSFDLDTFASQISNPILKRMFGYWRAKAGARKMPTRSDIDPVEIPYALGFVMLVEVQRNPLRFRFRLDGSKLVWHFGEDLTGRYTDELKPPEYADYVTGVYTNAVEAGGPQRYVRDLTVQGKPQRYEVVILPLGEANEINMLMLGMVPLA